MVMILWRVELSEPWDEVWAWWDTSIVRADVMFHVEAMAPGIGQRLVGYTYIIGIRHVNCAC